MLALAAFAGQGNADTTEWTRVSGSEIIMDGEFWNTGQWTNGTPDAAKDVIMNDSAMPNVKLCGKDSVLEMRSLTIREKDSMVWWTTSQEQDNMIVGGAFDSSSYAGPTLKVGEGGIRYDNATDGAAVIFGTAQIGISGDRYGYGFKNISVEGDIVFNNLGAIKMCYDPNEKYGTGNWSLDVGGVVRMNGSVENQRFILNSSFLLDTFTVAYIRLGGLDGSGVMRNSDGCVQPRRLCAVAGAAKVQVESLARKTGLLGAYITVRVAHNRARRPGSGRYAGRRDACSAAYATPSTTARPQGSTVSKVPRASSAPSSAASTRTFSPSQQRRER